MCEKNKTRQAQGKLDDSLQESMITFLASHRLFLNIFGGNKIQNGQIAWFIGYTIYPLTGFVGLQQKKNWFS